MPEILCPQDREIYESLLNAGYMSEALGIKSNICSSYSATDETDNKSTRARYLLIFLMANRLEKETCGKADLPCKACVATARITGDLAWDIILTWIMTEAEPVSTLGELDLISSFAKLLGAIRERSIKTPDALTIRRPSKGNK